MASMTTASEMIRAIFQALADGPMTLDALIGALASKAGPADLRARAAEALDRLIGLAIVEKRQVAGGGDEYVLLVPVLTLAPLVRTLGRDPWRRLNNWSQKLAPRESHTRSSSRVALETAAIASEPGRTGYYVQEVFFATDRKRAPNGGDIAFGSGRSPDETLTLGRAEISIPDVHELGNVESPSFVRLEFDFDPKKHVAVLRTESLGVDAFYDRLRTGLQSPEGNVLLFVHGYNVHFEDALRRTAQLTFDLQYDGVAITYSWPSIGDLVNYTHDENNAEWSQPHFQRFLLDLVRRFGAERINIVAHSMGNRLVARSLANIQDVDVSGPISTVVLAAPDIDRGVFVQLSQALSRRARNVVLYASSHDRALRVSKLVHGYSRAGDSDDIVVCDGIQSVDVSALEADFTGHGYFGNDINVVSDLYYLLKGQLPRRFRLKHIRKQPGGYWRFVP